LKSLLKHQRFSEIYNKTFPSRACCVSQNNNSEVEIKKMIQNTKVESDSKYQNSKDTLYSGYHLMGSLRDQWKLIILSK
jgi:hypothetical protein